MDFGKDENHQAKLGLRSEREAAEGESIIRHLKLKCLTLKIKNFKFAFNLRKNF